MTWTQPVCEDRFFMICGENAVVHRVKVPESEWDPCCFCRRPTNIYVRLDPETVPYPREEHDRPDRGTR
jgi:hypothetical protein